MKRTSVFHIAESQTHVGVSGTERIILGLVLAAAAMFPHLAAAAGPAPVNLLSTSRFAILAETEITGVPVSRITGDAGLGPAARSFITGVTQPRARTKEGEFHKVNV